MIAYKLFRELSDGGITPLFINKTSRLPIGEWMPAESHPTKGYKYRPHWHCTNLPHAPHLSLKRRHWYMVEMEDFTEFERPERQGGKWFLANKIKILGRFYIYSLKGMRIKTYGQEVEVENLEWNGTEYEIILKEPVVVPTITYTKSCIKMSEIQEILN